VTGAILKPLYFIIGKTIKNIGEINYGEVRSNVIVATEEITNIKDSFNNPNPSPSLPPLSSFPN